MAQAVPNLCVGRKVFLKHQESIGTQSGAIQDLPYDNIWFADNPVEVLSPCWLDVMYQLRSSMCATKISLGLIINVIILLA